LILPDIFLKIIAKKFFYKQKSGTFTKLLQNEISHNKKIYNMSKKKTVKELKTLTTLPKDEYIAMMKELNPDLTDNDLRDMFPEGWEANHIDISGNNYDSFRKTQILIDSQLEEQFCGGYESDDDFDY
jgi:hypothetical protein